MLGRKNCVPNLVNVRLSVAQEPNRRPGL